MTGRKDLFKMIDDSKNLQVRLGDNKSIQVEGEGTVGISTSPHNIMLVHNIRYAPTLAHNLLSVGQVLSKE